MLAAVFIARAGVSDEIKPVPTDTTAGGGTAVLEKKPEETKTEVIEPLFVRPLTKIEAGRNDSNPTWSPLGTLIAFERSRGDTKGIIITYPDGTPVQTIYFHLSEGGKDMRFFFPGVYEETSYNAGVTWSPAGNRFVFMSNGGEGNYDLYLREVGGSTTTRLTDHKEKDGQAHWSPVADTIVFVSGRTGNGDVYLTAGVAALPEEEQAEIVRRVQGFDTFTPDNDPHYEHDFGSFINLSISSCTFLLTGRISSDSEGG